MLTIVIPHSEFFNNDTNEFITVKETELQLEHSLMSVAKWESKWHKPFLGKEKKTVEEIQDYIRCMTLTKNIDPLIYRILSNDILKQIYEYINDPMTATWFNKMDEKLGGIGRRDVITAEIIYYWMITLNIPVQFEKWHLNRLITLIKVVNIKNTPSKKMSQAEVLKQNAALNRARKAKLKSKG